MTREHVDTQSIIFSYNQQLRHHPGLLDLLESIKIIIEINNRLSVSIVATQLNNNQNHMFCSTMSRVWVCLSVSHENVRDVEYECSSSVLLTSND